MSDPSAPEGVVRSDRGAIPVRTRGDEQQFLVVRGIPRSVLPASAR